MHTPKQTLRQCSSSKILYVLGVARDSQSVAYAIVSVTWNCSANALVWIGCLLGCAVVWI